MFKKWRLLALFWLLFGIANMFRAGMAYRLTGALAPYPPAVALPFLGWLYAGWGVAFLVGAVFAWRQIGQRWIVLLALVYQATLWMVRLCAYRADYARNLWVRDALLTSLFVLVVVWLAHEKQSQRIERI